MTYQNYVQGGQLFVQSTMFSPTVATNPQGLTSNASTPVVTVVETVGPVQSILPGLLPLNNEQITPDIQRELWSVLSLAQELVVLFLEWYLYVECYLAFP